MKHGINKVTLVGNVGEAPTIRKTEDNQKVANFSVATNEVYKDKDGNEIKKTQWHRIVAWRGNAEIISQYVKKGDPLYIEGKIQTNTWEDKEGKKKYSTEIYCESFLMLPRREND